jgi:large subunit ribosomal protein L10
LFARQLARSILLLKGGERKLAINKERKAELVKIYSELIQKSEALVLIEYAGLNMKGIEPLRRKLREASGELHVVKNTLALLALKQAGRPLPATLFTRSTAIGFAFTDVPALAKALMSAAKDSEFIKVKGGLLGTQVLDPKQVQALAELPPLPVVRAQLLGLLATPASRLTGIIAGGVRQIVNVVKAYSDKEDKPEEAAAAA